MKKLTFPYRIWGKKSSGEWGVKWLTSDSQEWNIIENALKIQDGLNKRKKL